jgi:hypothetical protein
MKEKDSKSLISERYGKFEFYGFHKHVVWLQSYQTIVKERTRSGDILADNHNGV